MLFSAFNCVHNEKNVFLHSAPLHFPKMFCIVLMYDFKWKWNKIEKKYLFCGKSKNNPQLCFQRDQSESCEKRVDVPLTKRGKILDIQVHVSIWQVGRNILKYSGNLMM